MVRTILSTERYLVVVDNLETIDGYRDLVYQFSDLFRSSKALLTTREKVAVVQDVYSVSLRGFTENEAITFLRSWASQRGDQAQIIYDAPTKDLAAIHQATGGLPLAIELVAGQAMNSSLDEVLERLQQVNYHHLEHVSSDQDAYNTLFRFIYRDAWRQLSDTARSLLIDIGTFDLNEGADMDELELMSGLPARAVFTATAELVNFSLVRRTMMDGVTNYALHPLTYYFVQADLPGASQ